MRTIYIQTKNGKQIPRVYHNQSKMQHECRDRNAAAKNGEEYSYITVSIADS